MTANLQEAERAYRDALRRANCCQGDAHLETQERLRLATAALQRATLEAASGEAAWEPEATRLGLTVTELRQQVALADEILEEVLAEERDDPLG